MTLYDDAPSQDDMSPYDDVQSPDDMPFIDGIPLHGSVPGYDVFSSRDGTSSDVDVSSHGTMPLG